MLTYSFVIQSGVGGTEEPSIMMMMMFTYHHTKKSVSLEEGMKCLVRLDRVAVEERIVEK
jgi:hypothetical protein